MIKPSLIFFLFGACVLLVLGFLVIKSDRPSIDMGDQKSPEKLTNSPGSPIVLPFDVSKVESINVKKGDVTIKMDKKDKNWVMTSHKDRPVKAERVDMLLGNMNLAKVEDLREGKDTAFALDEKNRTELTVSRGAEKTVLYLGKTVQGLKCFVRRDPSGDIFEIDKALDADSGVRPEKTDERNLDPSYFFDLKILSLNADDLIDIAIKKDHDVVRLQKVIPGKGPVQPKQELNKDDPKPVWWITEPEGSAVDEGAVTRITSQLTINAKSYADTVPEKDRGFDKPAAKAKLRLKDGTEYNLVFGKVDAQDVFLQIEGRPDPYKIDKYVYDAIVQKFADLKKKDTVEPDKNKPDQHSTAAPGPQIPPNAPQLTPEQMEQIKRQISKQMQQQHIPAAPPQDVNKQPEPPPAVVKPKEEAPKK
jgi:hypothetical protein